MQKEMAEATIANANLSQSMSTHQLPGETQAQVRDFGGHKALAVLIGWWLAFTSLGLLYSAEPGRTCWRSPPSGHGPVAYNWRGMRQSSG